MRPIRSRLGRARAFIGATVVAVGVVACQEQLPTGVGGDIAGSPVTIEIELPWSEFASDLEVFGGYGAPSELGVGALATNYGGVLDARTLMRFAQYPDRATVRDSSGTNRTDSAIAIYQGYLVAHFDTTASTNTGPVDIGLSALQTAWHRRSANWTNAVDTIGGSEAWLEAGGGPVTAVTTATWDPADGDSVRFFLDSAQVAAWADTSDVTAGARLEMVTEGVRLHLRSAMLQLAARPSLDPDTVIFLDVPTRGVTFIYDPAPTAPADGFRVGGAPAWRSVLDLALPTVLNGPQALCDAVGCPHTLTESEISYAALVLTSRATEAGFEPSDSVSLDSRPVLAREALPKAPMGTSFIASPLGRRVAASAFGAGAGQRVEIPLTGLVRAIVAGEDAQGASPPATIALLTVVEPLSITFASFEGPGVTGEPRLRLLITVGPAVELP